MFCFACFCADASMDRCYKCCIRAVQSHLCNHDNLYEQSQRSGFDHPSTECRTTRSVDFNKTIPPQLPPRGATYASQQPQFPAIRQSRWCKVPNCFPESPRCACMCVLVWVWRITDLRFVSTGANNATALAHFSPRGM